jgi:signal peptidase I
VTLSVFLLILALAAVLGLVAGAGLLWLTSRIVRVHDVTWKRILMATVVIWTVSLAGGLVTFSTREGGAANFLFLGLWLAVGLAAIQRAFRSGIGRALLALLVWGGLDFLLWFAAVSWFRGKILESFSIPTGNMAPTFLGIHLESRCSHCGFLIAIGRPGGEVPLPDAHGSQFSCPNCLTPHPGNAFALAEGDRVSIDKTTRPRRWDPAAFIAPWDRGSTYLQRLVGLPGETIEMAGGDVFANRERLVKQPGTAEDMWIVVHDGTRVPARGQAPAIWIASSPQSGWRPASPAGWQFSGSDGREESLAFEGPLTSGLTYNVLYPRVPPGDNPSDVKLDCAVGSFRGTGRFGFRWQYGDASAEVRLSASGVIDFKTHREAQTLQAALADFQRADIAFGVRDGQAFITVNRKLVAALPLFAANLDEFTRQRPASPPPCRLAIVAMDCELALTSLGVKRDIHYQGVGVGGPCAGCPGNPIALGQDDHYFLGDNSAVSSDSRFRGAVPGHLILGPVRMTFWPRERWRYYSPSR